MRVRTIDEMVQESLNEQRERIVVGIRKQAEGFNEHGAIRAVLIALAHDVQMGKIGGEEK